MLQNTTARKNVSLSSLLRFEHLLFDGGEELGTDTTTALFTVVSFSVALSYIVVFFSFVFIPRGGGRGFGGFLRLLLGGGSLS